MQVKAGRLLVFHIPFDIHHLSLGKIGETEAKNDKWICQMEYGK
jgi:hypothetical protein